MSALTSLLARDHAVPVRMIEEAISRQVVVGGEMSSALLELDAIAENPLAAYQAALYGLLPATRDEVMRVPRDAIRLVPREIAEKHRLVPLAVDGRTLVVARAEPLDRETEAQLGFLLGYTLVTRIVCEVRVSGALLHHYGIEPSARHLRLIERLRHRDAGPVPYVAPPAQGKLDPAQRASLAKKVSVSAWLDEADDPEPPAVPAARPSSVPPRAQEARSTDPLGVPRSHVEAFGSLSSPPVEAGSDGSSQARHAPDEGAGALGSPREHPPHRAAPSLAETTPDGRLTSPYGEGRVDGPVPFSGERLSAVSTVGVEASPVSKSVVADPRPVARAELDVSSETRALGELAPRESASPEMKWSTSKDEPSRTSALGTALENRPQAPRAARVRGPLTAARAVRLLEEATERDEILGVFFAFARQFFDYAALFSVQDDHADGRDAFGEGASAARVRALSLPLGATCSSALAEARRSGAPHLTTLEGDANEDLAALLERPRGVFALVYPLALRGRVVMLLYGDRSGDRFDLTDFPELAALVPRVLDALSKLILRKKREHARSSFDRAPGEVRTVLKEAASAMRRASPPLPLGDSRAQDHWSSERASHAPPPSAIRPPTPTSSLAEAIALAEAVVQADIRPSHPEGLPGPNSDASTFARVQDLAGRALAEAVAIASVASEPIEVAPGDAFRPTEEHVRVPAVEPASPALSPVAPRRGRQSLLGIPRAAPPPPAVDDGLFTAGWDMSASASPEATDASEAFDDGPSTIPVPPPDPQDDSPEIVVSEAPESDESPDPEVHIAESDEPFEDEETLVPSPPIEGARVVRERRLTPTAYALRDAGVDVVAQGARTKRLGSSRPPPVTEEVAPSARSQRDPRREDDVSAPSCPIPGEGPAADPRFPHGRPPDAFAKSAILEPSVGAGGRPTHDREVPSVIVDMGESMGALVEDLLRARPDDVPALIEALLAVGEAALPVLAQAFPGPLWVDRRRSRGSRPRGRDVSAVARALVDFRDKAAPYVAALTGASEPERRYCALLVAAENPSAALAGPVIARAFDDDPDVRALALELLPAFQAFPETQEQLGTLRRTARIRGKDPARRLHAIAALVALRDAGALSTLVDLLEDEDAAVSRAAHGALVGLTCEDLGPSHRRWAAWAEKNEHRHRIEWLIDALLHADETLRARAGDELKNATQQYFGFHPSAPRKEREVAQAKYRAWWESEGRHAMR